MALENVEVPLYILPVSDEKRRLIVNELAGRIQLTIEREGKEEITIAFFFDNLELAWNAVKRS